MQRHQRQPGYDAGETEQNRDADRQPVEYLDDRRRDEPFPLKKITIIEHRDFSSGAERRPALPRFQQSAQCTGRWRTVNQLAGSELSSISTAGALISYRGTIPGREAFFSARRFSLKLAGAFARY